MPSKLKITIGHVGFEYEGDAAFTQDSITDLLTKVEGVFGATQRALPPKPASSPNDTGSEGSAALTDGQANDRVAYPSTIAAHLSVGSGPELVLATAAFLQLGQGKSSFTRGELLKSMKLATAYYQDTYSGNLTAMLKRLVMAKRLNQVGTEVYALSASERQSLEAKLAA